MRPRRQSVTCFSKILSIAWWKSFGVQCQVQTVLSRICYVPKVWQRCTGTNSVYQELSAKKRFLHPGPKTQCYHFIVQTVLPGWGCDSGAFHCKFLGSKQIQTFLVFHIFLFEDDDGVDLVSRFRHSIIFHSFKLSLHSLFKCTWYPAGGSHYRLYIQLKVDVVLLKACHCP